MPERAPGPLTWSEVAGRLSAPRYYWLHTTSPSGGPDASPVWAVVLDEVVYAYSCRSTVKAQNLVLDPRVVVNLESGVDVVIVHGLAEDLGRPGDSPAVVEASARKYDLRTRTTG